MQTPSSAAPAATRDAAEAVVARVVDGRTRIREELQKVIVGQHEAVDLVLTALFTGGHCLITGVPGLAKTLLIKSLAEILDLSFKRIQFTPDLMPADITGTEILDESSGTRVLRFVQGPIFAQIVLADEVNRTPPKTQAALLEAMQEKHVTAAGRTMSLDLPFLVLATYAEISASLPRDSIPERCDQTGAGLRHNRRMRRGSPRGGRQRSEC